MRILNTTLSFITENSQKESPSLRSADLSALYLRSANLSSFYLAGQGAVFVIPTSGFRTSGFENTFIVGSGTNGGVILSGSGGGMGGGSGGGIGSGVGPYVVGNGVKTPVIVDNADLSQQQERIRKELEKAREKVKKMREETEATRQKFLQSLSDVKVHLIEALANYGDSLTTVKPDECINLVLVTDGFDDQRTRSDIISARKSWITDYKAGRLNLDSFKLKVIQYTE